MAKLPYRCSCDHGVHPCKPLLVPRKGQRVEGPGITPDALRTLIRKLHDLIASERVRAEKYKEKNRVLRTQIRPLNDLIKTLRWDITNGRASLQAVLDIKEAENEKLRGELAELKAAPRILTEHAGGM